VGILASALREARKVPAARPRPSWSRILLTLGQFYRRNPVTAGALTALWALILVFRISTPVESAAERRLMAQVDPNQPVHLVSLSEQMRLAELWQDEPEERRMP
jgi:hypothetical protein